MRTKEEIIKEFNESPQSSPTLMDIVFKRLMLEISVDRRDIEERKYVLLKKNVQ